jgi:hypothetical protein
LEFIGGGGVRELGNDVRFTVGEVPQGVGVNVPGSGFDGRGAGGVRTSTIVPVGDGFEGLFGGVCGGELAGMGGVTRGMAEIEMGGPARANGLGCRGRGGRRGGRGNGSGFGFQSGQTLGNRGKGGLKGGVGGGEAGKLLVLALAGVLEGIQGLLLALTAGRERVVGLGQGGEFLVEGAEDRVVEAALKGAEGGLLGMDAALDFGDHRGKVGVTGVKAADGVLKFPLKGQDLVMEGGDTVRLGSKGGGLRGGGSVGGEGTEGVRWGGGGANMFDDFVSGQLELLVRISEGGSDGV